MTTHRTIRPMSLLLSPMSEYLFDEQNCHSFGNLPANEDQGLKRCRTFNDTYQYQVLQFFIMTLYIINQTWYFRIIPFWSLGQYQKVYRIKNAMSFPPPTFTCVRHMPYFAIGCGSFFPVHCLTPHRCRICTGYLN